VPVRHTDDHLPLAREGRELSEVANAEHRIGMPDTHARNRIGVVRSLFEQDGKI